MFSLTLEIAKILIANGADPNALNRFGESPLFEAVRSRRPEPVQFLIDHGARVNITDYDGVNLINFGQNFPGMAEILRRALERQIADAELLKKSTSPKACDGCKEASGTKRCTG